MNSRLTERQALVMVAICNGYRANVPNGVSRALVIRGLINSERSRLTDLGREMLRKHQRNRNDR